MTQNDSLCPGCGAPRLPASEEYECGSFRYYPSPGCVATQLAKACAEIARLERALAAALQENKNLRDGLGAALLVEKPMTPRVSPTASSAASVVNRHPRGDGR